MRRLLTWWHQQGCWRLGHDWTATAPYRWHCDRCGKDRD